MAALRLRLAFDYPPPLLPSARFCWLLLPDEQCRVVADLESIIRGRFGFSRRTRLHLFLDGGLLPPNESVLLVRDNDSIRVRQEELPVDGPVASEDAGGLLLMNRKGNRHQSAERKSRKRRKLAELSEGQTPNSTEESVCGITTEHLGKRKKAAEDGAQKKQGKKRKYKHSKKWERIEACSESPTLQRHSLATTCTVPALGSRDWERVVPRSESPTLQRHPPATTCTASTSDRFSAGEPDHHAPATNGFLSVPGLAGKGQNCRSSEQTRSMLAAAETSSSTDTHSSDSDTPMGSREALPSPASITALPASSSSAGSGDSQPEKSGEVETASGCQTASPPAPPCHPGRIGFGLGCGRGRGRGGVTPPWVGARGWQQRGPTRGRGRGTGGPHNRCPRGRDTKPGEWLDPSPAQHWTSESVPKVPQRDYSKLPLLAAPPQVGERIAFKVLELSENYTPELSDYKEGRIVSYDAETQQVELSVESESSESSKEPGKFDLVYQSENGEEVVEYAVTRETQLTQSWSSLVEPRLIVPSAAETEALEMAC
ncbi:coilin [Hypanus sabinus]|uniref:coilin n=1 Tax=Hypanus sabinus TaxID=79690 RepID=UPI0028C4E4D5|nr:coilin [Hypanus sabinus]